MKTIGGHENPSWLPRSLATGGRVSFIGAVRPLLCNGIQSGPDRMRDDRVKSHWKQRFAYNTKGALTKPIKYCTARRWWEKNFHGRKMALSCLGSSHAFSHYYYYYLYLLRSDPYRWWYHVKNNIETLMPRRLVHRHRLDRRQRPPNTLLLSFTPWFPHFLLFHRQSNSKQRELKDSVSTLLFFPFFLKGDLTTSGVK